MEKSSLTNRNYLFTSQRLGFRKFHLGDSDNFYSMNSNEEVMRYFPSLLTKDQSDSLLDKINTHIDENGFGFFAVDHLDTNTFIGFIGLKRTNFEADFTPCVEIGWRLIPDFWNQGLATEGASRCLEFAFSKLGLDTIYSFTPIINKPSERVMQKIGMIKDGEFEHPLVKQDHRLKIHSLYKISKQKYMDGIKVL
ncbi:MAG: GNAT family N-acetyltransferase [Balneola sp.]